MVYESYIYEVLYFLNQVGDLGYFFGCFVNFIPYMCSLAFKVDDKSIITGMLYCIDTFIILWNL